MARAVQNSRTVSFFVIALWAFAIGLLLCCLKDRRQWFLEVPIRAMLRVAVAVGNWVIFGFVLYGWMAVLRELFDKH